MITRDKMVHSRNSNDSYDMANAMANVSLDGIFNDNSTNKIQKTQDSTNNSSYLPMKAGVRTTLWKEGYEYREFRRKNGFNHAKLEWIVPTDRTYVSIILSYFFV